MKTVEEIKEQKTKLIKKATQALDESCYRDYRELMAMDTILSWVLGDNKDDTTTNKQANN